MTTLEKIQKIKYLRLKPEERFLIEILDKVEFVYDDEKPDSEFYQIDGEILFEQDSKNGWFLVHSKIWAVLEMKFNLSHKEIREIIQSKIQERLKRKVEISIIFPEPLTKHNKNNRQI